MSCAALPGVPERLWSEARASPLRLLALDYDGTLAPFAIDPAAARPHPAARAALERVVREGRTRVALLTGRPAVDVARLVGPLPAPIVGEHGWSFLFPDGALLRFPLAPELVGALDALQDQLERRLAPARIERKRTAVVVHTRGLAPEFARAAIARARRLFAEGATDPRLALRDIDGGLEVRALGRDKGSALTELACRVGSGAFVVAVGDDDTDEDAFRAAAGLGGWGVRVGLPARTRARASLASPADVAVFLHEWSSRVDAQAWLPDPEAAPEQRP